MSKVVFVYETWSTEKPATNVPGFNLFRKNRQFSRGKGVCIYIRNNLDSYPVNEKFLLDENLEQIWCMTEVGKENFLCGCIYKTKNSDLKNRSGGSVFVIFSYAHMPYDSVCLRMAAYEIVCVCVAYAL